jgi:uncharacterized Ntn-hydrolase superfamily protein
MLAKNRLLPFYALLLGSATLLALPAATPAQPADQDIVFNTFSLAAYDPDNQDWGVVVTTKVPNVGNAVPWAKAGVGAVATQASTNKAFGPDGLAMLAKGMSPAEVAKSFQETDKKIDVRQFGIVDAKGNSFAFTGKGCGVWAGHKTGKNYSCQGNILAGEAVVNDMVKVFEETKGRLAVRFMAALEAGSKAGGDKRTNKTQSAAMLIVHDNSGGK